uniref:Ion_trans_2 domain-containing protein n=1 Tax=Macrostomum lignano TaxID=282301 RepID=A0A1I8HHX5_9PLAT
SQQPAASAEDAAMAEQLCSAGLPSRRGAAAVSAVNFTDSALTYGYCCAEGGGPRPTVRCEVRFKLAFLLLCGVGGVSLLVAGCSAAVAGLQRLRRRWDALDDFLSRPLMARSSGLSIRADSDLSMPELAASARS